MAVAGRNFSPALLLHSDRGSQYVSEPYQLHLLKNGIICSMSGKGNCLRQCSNGEFLPYFESRIDLSKIDMRPEEKPKGIYLNTLKSFTTGRDYIPL